MVAAERPTNCNAEIVAGLLGDYGALQSVGEVFKMSNTRDKVTEGLFERNY